MQSLAAAVAAGLVIGMALSVALGSVLARWSIPSLEDPLVLFGVVATLLLRRSRRRWFQRGERSPVEPAVTLRTD